MAVDLKSRKRLRRFIKEKFFLRLHTSLILMATFFVGVIVSKVLLVLNVDGMIYRYPIAVLLSYLAFFVFIKIWLYYLAVSTGRKDSSGLGDGCGDLLGSTVDGGYGSPIKETASSIKPGGGSFGGGGASGSFDALTDEAGTAICEEAVASGAADATGEIVSGTAEGVAGEAAGAAVEGGGLILIVLGLVLALVAGAGAYFIYEAPAILSEVAFEFLLATSLIKGAKRLDQPDWIGGVFRATWKPFAIILAIAMFVAVVSNVNCPEATKLSEVLRLCL